jgi:hypothetical protein
MDFWQWLKNIRNHTDDAQYYSSNSGVTLTIIINTVIAAVLILLFILGCSQITIFNVKKKRKLFEKYLSRKKSREKDLGVIENESSIVDHLDVQNEDEMLLNEIKHIGKLSDNRVWSYIQTRYYFLWEIIRAMIVPSHRKRDQGRTVLSYGRDFAVYFYWQQQVIYSFFFITIIVLATLLPIHMTGTLPQDLRDDNSTLLGDDILKFNDTSEYDLLRTSIRMVITSPAKTSAHVALMFVILVVVSILLIYQFAQSKLVNKFNYLCADEDILASKEYIKHSKDKIRPKEEREQMILPTNTTSSGKAFLACAYTLELKNIPPDVVDHEEFSRMVRALLNHPHNKFHSITDDVLKSVLVYDFSKREELQDRLKDCEEQLDHYEYVYQETEKRPTVTLWFKKVRGEYHIRQTTDALQYYRELKDKTIHKIECWNESFLTATQSRSSHEKPMYEEDMVSVAISSRVEHPVSQYVHKTYPIRGSGFGYIVFRTLDALHDFKRNFKRYGSSMGWRGKPSTITYESQDANWKNIYIIQKRWRFEPFFRKLLGAIGMIIILIFFSSPIALSSTIQNILKLGTISRTIEWVSKLTGDYGPLLFQYLPTLLLLVSSSLIPFIIVKLASLSKSKTYSKLQRKIMQSIFVYLILSTLVLPSLLLTSVDALIEFFVINADRHFTVALAKLFIPSNGAFFLNYVLQKGILSNVLALLQIGTVIAYFWTTRFTSRVFYGTPLYRPMTDGEKLKAAEMAGLQLELEYAQQISVIGIALCFGLFSPLVLPAALLFFVSKHLIDRYSVACSYGHKQQINDQDLYGAGFGAKSDFMAHRKNAFMLIELLLVDMLLMTLFLSVFFGSKVESNGWFLIHAVTCTLMLITVALGMLGWYLLRYFSLNRNEVLINRKNTHPPSAEMCELSYTPPQLWMVKQNNAHNSDEDVPSDHQHYGTM